MNSTQTDLEKRFPKSFKRILTSLNGDLANLSNTAFKRLIRNHTTHHIYIYYIYVIYIYYIYIYVWYIYGVLDIYALNLFIEHSGDISCSLLVNPSHTGESWEGRNTCLWIYKLWIYSLSTQENTDENRILFVHSPHHKCFGKVQHLMLCALWGHQLFSTR